MIALKINVKDNITTSIKKKIAQLDTVPDQAYTFFKAHTPIRSGNARSRTVLKKDTIVAAYPYAQRLDDGYSPQAPDGMSRPTEAFVQKTVDKILKKK
jgi:hypothetical protein